MKQIKNPKGLFITAKQTVDPADKNKSIVTFSPSDVVPMRAGTGKMVHILDSDSPETVTYKGQDYYYSGNALCGAGRPSKSYPYGSSQNISGAAGFVDYGEEIKLSLGDFQLRGRRYVPITITCYRCLKLHALNKGPVFQRGFAPTTQGHQELHEMLPGGREGFYGEEFDEFGGYDPDVQRAQAELAATDPDYWEGQQELFRVGAPYARTQPETIAQYEAAARKFGFDDPEKQVGTFPKTDVIRRKKNPALKVGDRIVEGKRTGTVDSFHSDGTVDVRFDDVDFVMRRQLGSGIKAHKNPSVRAEIQRMINTAPSSWLTMFKRYKLGSKPTVAKLISTVLEFTPSMNRYGDKGSTVYTPPKQVRSEALAGLRLSYRHDYSSASGIGLVRAMQLAVEPTVWRRTVERMFAYFDRHISDTESSTFGNNVQPSRGWIAWLNWGGTAGYEWSASILGKQRKLMFGERGYNRNDRSKRVKDTILPMAANPSERKQGILFENYDPRSAQFTAQVQGVYESLVRKDLRKKSTTKFKTAKGVRLDGRFSQPRVSRILGNAFAVATRAGQKHKYLKKGTNKPTAKGKQRAAERQKDKPHLMENILDYETTLYLARKNREPRILKKGKRFYIMPEGTYRGTLQAAIDYIKRKQKRGGRRIANPSKVDTSSPQFSDARFRRGKFRVLVDPIPVYHPDDDYKGIPDDKKRVIGKRDSYLIGGSKSVFSVLGTAGFKEAVSSRAMRETYEREDLGRPAEEISLAETLERTNIRLHPTTEEVKLLQFINKHYRSLPALPPREGDPPPKMPAKFSLFDLMQAVARGAVGIGIYNQVKLLGILKEFVEYGVITKEQYPRTATIVRQRTKQLKESRAKENALVEKINKLTGQNTPQGKRALAAAQRQLLKFRTENLIFDDANIRDVAGTPETFKWVMPPKSIFAAKQLGILPNYTQKRGLESQQLVLFNPMFRYQIRPNIEKMTAEERTLQVFGAEVKTTVLVIEGQERKKSKATGDEVFFRPVLGQKFRITPKKRGVDRTIKLAQKTALKNYYAIIQQAAQKYQDDNPKINVTKGLNEGTINIPTKYFAALTLLDWVRVDRFLLGAVNKGKGTNYIAETGGIKIAGGVAYSVVKYAQARGLPLPDQKVFTPRTAEQRSASKKSKAASKAAPKTDPDAKAIFTTGSASSGDPSEGTPLFSRKKK